MLNKFKYWFRGLFNSPLQMFDGLPEMKDRTCLCGATEFHSFKVVEGEHWMIGQVEKCNNCDEELKHSAIGKMLEELRADQ